MSEETKYVCQCPKCGCEIERVKISGGIIRRNGEIFHRIPSRWKFREIKKKKRGFIDWIFR